jgi:hypothetical protein
MHHHPDNIESPPHNLLIYLDAGMDFLYQHRTAKLLSNTDILAMELARRCSSDKA